MTDVQNEELSNDADLPTSTEGSDLSSEETGPVNKDIPVGQNDTAQAQALPGAPGNEYEALKESLLGSEPSGTIDEVVVNVELLDNEEENPGVLFHEHSNYDTTVLNHVGGPYLTDVENARDAVIAERRLANNDADRLKEIDKGEAEKSADANAIAQMRNASNANIAEREAFLRESANADVNEQMQKNSAEGGMVPPPARSPSGVNPTPDPNWTVPGTNVDTDVSSLTQDDAGNVNVNSDPAGTGTASTE